LSTVEERRPGGSLKISKDVIATIAKTTAMEIQGVASLSGSEAPSMEKILPRGIGRKAIKISLTDDFAEIDVAVKLKYGASIPAVSLALQAGIKENVQTMTGIAVLKVNVTVAGIVFPDESGLADL